MNKRLQTMIACLMILALSLVLMPAQSTVAADIFTEPFDDNSQFTTSEAFFSDGGWDYFGLPDGAGGGDYGTGPAPTGLKAYTGFSGSFLAGMDLDALPVHRK